MRMLILSDLHIEVWRDHLPTIDASVSKPDVVILAGDIHTRSRAPDWAAKAFPDHPVLYVAGNHEFYGESIEGAGAAIRHKCKLNANIHYMDCDEYVIQGVRFLGVTLWTDFSLLGKNRTSSAMSEAQRSLNDYQRIKVAATGYQKLHPQDTAGLHVRQKKWLEEKLAEPFPGPTVVVTHMAPSVKSISREYADELISSAFASNLDSLVGKADFWIHGHTHSSFDYHLGACRVIANPLGYMLRCGSPENENFNPNFFVDLN